MGQRVLVVDDDVRIRTLAVRSLERAGFEAAAAASLAEALVQIDRSPFDVAILDYFLTGTECGCDLIAPLRAANPSIRIVVLSGLAILPELDRHARRSGADAVASKGRVDWRALARGELGARSAAATSPTQLEAFKRAVIHGMYLVHHRNVTSTARALGVPRTSLQRMLRRQPAPVFEEDE
jgi:ActR/RegA family two-component response regulator